MLVYVSIWLGNVKDLIKDKEDLKEIGKEIVELGKEAVRAGVDVERYVSIWLGEC
jgi:hypothetical protein